MCNRCCTTFLGKLRQPRRLQSAFRAHAKGVSLSTQYITGDQVLDNTAEKVLFAVDQDVFDGAKRHGPLFERYRGISVDAACVDGRRDHLATIGFSEPRHAERRIEAAGKRKNNRGQVLAHNGVLWRST
jgi:hypothetical protein